MSLASDVTVIGAGIVGMATAMKLSMAYPGLKIAVVEKESSPARHQTGNNSGVIHSGIYYRPGSLKARTCVSGARQLIRFCDENDFPYELCGKVVVATQAVEIPRLLELHRRGTANGVTGMRLLSPSQVKEIEPHVQCLRGLSVPTTGIIDFRKLTQVYSDVFIRNGGTLSLGSKVTAIREDSHGTRVETERGSITTRVMINCAGLYADRIAAMAGDRPACQIVPIRGEYYKIRPQSNHLIRNLIYPVPDPRFPFLGVHFTRRIDGQIEAGPNAVLAWAREGYSKTDFSSFDLLEILKYRGSWNMLRHYWRTGFHEMIRSYSKDRFAKALQQLVPSIRKDDLLPGGAGVRAQAVGPDGSLMDDFAILRSRRLVHVLNAPSPAATSALAIADHIIGTTADLYA